MLVSWQSPFTLSGPVIRNLFTFFLLCRRSRHSPCNAISSTNPFYIWYLSEFYISLSFHFLFVFMCSFTFVYLFSNVQLVNRAASYPESKHCLICPYFWGLVGFVYHLLYITYQTGWSRKSKRQDQNLQGNQHLRLTYSTVDACEWRFCWTAFSSCSQPNLWKYKHGKSVHVSTRPTTWFR